MNSQLNILIVIATESKREISMSYDDFIKRATDKKEHPIFGTAASNALKALNHRRGKTTGEINE